MSACLAPSLVHNRSQRDSCQVAEGDLSCTVTNKEPDTRPWKETAGRARALLYLLPPQSSSPCPTFVQEDRNEEKTTQTYIYMCVRAGNCLITA